MVSGSPRSAVGKTMWLRAYPCFSTSTRSPRSGTETMWKQVLPFELETARPGCQPEDQPAIVRIFDDRSEGTSTSVKSSWRKRPATRLQQTRARPAPKLEVL
jgi:hypothetical protein